MMMHERPPRRPEQPEPNRETFRWSHGRLTQLALGLSLVFSAPHTFKAEPAAATTMQRPDDAGRLTVTPEYPKLGFGDGDSITVWVGDAAMVIESPWNHSAAWDQPAAPVDVSDNDLYSALSNLFETQYNLALSTTDNDVQAPINLINKYAYETNRLPAGTYVGFDKQLYSNLDWGDKAVVEEQFEMLWKRTAAAKGWGTDLDTLTYYQWTEVLEAPAKQLRYDNRLLGTDPRFDSEYAEQQLAKTIQEKLEAGVGVCRDVESINIASYVSADEQYHLADKGLALLVHRNAGDAKHARSTWVLADDAGVRLLGSDTTLEAARTQLPIPETTLPSNTLSWVINSVGTEVSLSAAERADFIATTLDQFADDTLAVEQAMLTRELIVAQLQSVVEGDGSLTEDQRITILTAAYTALQTMLNHNRLENDPILQLPSRMVPLYDLLIEIGYLLDNGATAVDAESIARLLQGERSSSLEPKTNVGYAIMDMNDYLNATGVDLEAARIATEELFRLQMGTEKEAALQKIQALAEAYNTNRQ